MKWLICLLACIVLFNCDDTVADTNNGIVYNGFDELPIDNYYPSEIIDDSYLDIYGFWRCYQVSGGWAGSSYDPDPDFYFEIKPFGIWGVIQNDTLQDFGKIESLKPQLGNAPLVRFISDDSTKYFLDDLEKYIYLFGQDTLLLEAPCCDRYSYHFVREDYM